MVNAETITITVVVKPVATGHCFDDTNREARVQLDSNSANDAVTVPLDINP